MISLGGYTWSKWFSAAAATEALRTQLVSSCIDMYLKGNLPVSGNRGGPGAAAGVFDGIDIDWEYPGGGGNAGNTESPDDQKNFTLLLAEFRKQMDALSKTTGKQYYLSVAISAAPSKIAQTAPGIYSKYTDFINLMAYDFHGGWEGTGPSTFMSNLYLDPNGPYASVGDFSIDSAVHVLLADGAPSSKINVGIPFYGTGWTVGANAANNGLYQTATAALGTSNYNVLATAAGNVHYSDVTKQLWKYDSVGGNFWTYDDATTIATKADYVKTKQLGGLFSWSLDGDDSTGTLVSAMGAINP
jgi:chitinase